MVEINPLDAIVFFESRNDSDFCYFVIVVFRFPERFLPVEGVGKVMSKREGHHGDECEGYPDQFSR